MIYNIKNNKSISIYYQGEIKQANQNKLKKR